jgi:hypothetical protein
MRRDAGEPILLSEWRMAQREPRGGTPIPRVTRFPPEGSVIGLKNLTLAAAAVLALPAVAAIPPPAGLAPALRVSADEEPAFMLSGNGVQVYECRLGLAEPNTYVWAFVAPEATLYEGSRTAARMASPNLVESASDRSSVSGFVRSMQPAGGNNLPWTVMRARPIGEDGQFAGVTSIQRVNTSGGMAPMGGCNADNVGAEARAAYSADYYFYKRRGAS